MSFGAFDVPRVVAEIEAVLKRGVGMRIVLGERESAAESARAQQMAHLGDLVHKKAVIFRWPLDRRLRHE